MPPLLTLKRLSTKAAKGEEELGIIWPSHSPFRGAIFKIARSFFCEGSDLDLGGRDSRARVALFGHSIGVALAAGVGRERREAAVTSAL